MHTQPRQLVQAWVDAFNRADADALAAFYTDGAVNHQVAESPVRGREAIRQMFAREFAATKWSASSRTSSKTANGRSSSGGIRWGLRGCGFFHVVGGQIVFQRGYWDKLSFLRAHGLPLPDEP